MTRRKRRKFPSTTTENGRIPCHLLLLPFYGSGAFHKNHPWSSCQCPQTAAPDRIQNPGRRSSDPVGGRRILLSQVHHLPGLWWKIILETIVISDFLFYNTWLPSFLSKHSTQESRRIQFWKRLLISFSVRNKASRFVRPVAFLTFSFTVWFREILI